MGRPGPKPYPKSAAVVRDMPGWDGTFPNGDVVVNCWCERKVVRVTRARMLAGRTEECGHPACCAPEPEGRWATLAERAGR